MRRSHPLALIEGMFPPTPAQIQARGSLGPSAGDAAYLTTINNIIAKLGQITSFYNGLDTLNLTDATAAQMNQFVTDLTALLGQLSNHNPSPHGVVTAKLALDRLCGASYPDPLHAMVNKIEDARQP